MDLAGSSRLDVIRPRPRESKLDKGNGGHLLIPNIPHAMRVPSSALDFCFQDDSDYLIYLCRLRGRWHIPHSKGRALRKHTSAGRPAWVPGSVKTAVVEAPGLATDIMVGGCRGDSGAARPVPDLRHQPPGPGYCFVTKN